MTDSAATTSDTGITLLPDTIKGKADWRGYRSFQLKNGVRCTVVHDKESKTLAAAAVVDTGAGADPRSMSGVAHFVEHALFLGSEKYPDENGYKAFLSAHGGRSNASTSLHTTTYKFEILSDFGDAALDRFAQFFVAPLFTASATGREVQAVDSENSKNLTADGRRRLQILKALGDPDHYYTKFTTGNAVTLPSDNEETLETLRTTLLAFHRKHYTPESLVVVVAGPQSLGELQSFVVEKFAPLQARPFPTKVEDMTPIELQIHEAARDLPNNAYFKPTPPYHPAFQPKLQKGGKWPTLLTTNPLKSFRKLSLMFQIPSDRAYPDRSPINVLSHLLGHEGPGSSFAVLQNHGLLSSLVAGPRSSGPDFTLFHVEMNLTEEGEERWQEVADIVYAHCRLIHQAAAKAQKGDDSELRTMWGEVTALRRIFFDQNSPGGVYDFAPNLVGSILVNGPDKCLSNGSMLNENGSTLPLDQIADFAARLVPSNCIMERCSHKAWEEMEERNAKSSSDGEDAALQKQTEPWYSIDYYTSQLDKKQIQHWEGSDTNVDGYGRINRDELHLPKPNLYIPRSLELCPELSDEAKLGPRIEKEIDPPQLILDNPIGRLWHRLDDRYALPKASMTLLLRNAAIENVLKDGLWKYDTKSSVHSSLLSGMFAEHMAQDTYDADLAGLYWSLSMTSSGLRLSCSGFSDRLPDLALVVLHEFLNGSFLKDTYLTNAKDRVVRSLSTFFQSRRSDSIAMYYRDLLLASNESGISSSLRAAADITLESAKKHHTNLLSTNAESSIDCLYSGNVSAKQAEAFFASASKLVNGARVDGAQPAGKSADAWVPGPLERRLPSGDTELHFPSNNPTEENGAVIVTYQSNIPGFKGEGMSSVESLQSSASIRLISHILREPLFDELRTKQQLGYIVHSYYDLSFSSPEPLRESNQPMVTPVDGIVVNVLSKKVDPAEVAKRIDAFIEEFRTTLKNTPESEIADHAKALKTKMLKPIQKLGSETSNHFSKIRRYAPEILTNGGSDRDLPWDNSKPLANAMENLKREHLVQAWDRLTLQKNRSRVTSHVYGSTFPLPADARSAASPRVVVDSLPCLIKMRKQLHRVDGKTHTFPSILNQLGRNKMLVGATTMALIGVGYVGLSMLSKSKKAGK